MDCPQVRSYLAANGISLVSQSISFFGACYWNDTCLVNDVVNDSRLIDGVFWAASAGNHRQAHRDNLSNGGTLSLTVAGGSPSLPLDLFLNWDQYAAGACDSNYHFTVRNKQGTFIGDPPYGSACSGGTPEEVLSFTYHEDNAPYAITVQHASGPTAPTTLVCTRPEGGNYCSLTNFVPARSLLNPGQATHSFVVTGCDNLTYSLQCTNDFFSEGPTKSGVIKPDLTAPTELMTVTKPIFTGTSASTPVVGGVAALLKGTKPAASAGQVETALSFPLAVDIGAVGKDTVWGHGRLVLTSSPPSPFTFTNQCTGLPATTLSQPQVSTAAPTSLIAVGGTGFGANMAVFVGGTKAVTFYSSATLATFRVPALPNGTYALRVLNPEGCRSLEPRTFTVDSSSGGGCGLLGIEALLPLFFLRRRQARRGKHGCFLVMAAMTILPLSDPGFAVETLVCPEPTELRQQPAGEGGHEAWCVKLLESGHDSKEGPYRLVSASGQPRMEGNYKDDVRVGTWRDWNYDGALTGEFEFLHGVSHGRSAFYFDNGRPRRIGYSKYGKRDGKWIHYFENGNVELEEQYAEGVLAGEFKSYFENGQVHQQGQYQDGKPVGLWTTWYENGTRAEEGTAEAGLRQGEWKFWNQNGELRETPTFDKGAATSARASGSQSISPGVRWAPPDN